MSEKRDGPHICQANSRAQTQVPRYGRAASAQRAVPRFRRKILYYLPDFVFKPRFFERDFAKDGLSGAVLFLWVLFLGRRRAIGLVP
jgi:hypothetical protein